MLPRWEQLAYYCLDGARDNLVVCVDATAVQNLPREFLIGGRDLKYIKPRKPFRCLSRMGFCMASCGSRVRKEQKRRSIGFERVMMCLDKEFHAPTTIYLYEGTNPADLDVEALAAFLRDLFPRSAVKVRKDFFRYWYEKNKKRETKALKIATKLSQVKVSHPERNDLNPGPLPGEVDFEHRFITGVNIKPAGILYDGYHVMTICSELLSTNEKNLAYCHIVLTNQLLGTWDENDRRYHVRVSIYGFPSIISSSGIVEGPAKPREYYLGRRLGADQRALEESFEKQYLGYGDPRLQEVTKGYLLQAMFYHMAGEPFCDDRDCRLFNAHWQEEMIHAQLRLNADLCHFHRQILKRASCRQRN